MTILLVGGGTGGHITPLLAVAHELKRRSPDIQVIAVTDYGNRFVKLLNDAPDIDIVRQVRAGKLRRYPNESLLLRLFDIKTHILNIRDVFRTIRGFFQARHIMRIYTPDIIFIKGGFVGVPVGFAAHVVGRPFITHDSDTVPGLANRIIARWARVHAVGMPEQFYNYPKSKMVYVGIPVTAQYHKVHDQDKRDAKCALDIPVNSQVVLITGGSQGARRLNVAVFKMIEELLQSEPSLYVIHQIGSQNNIGDFVSERYRKKAFIDDMSVASAASDVIVARPGASTIAELGIQSKPVIVVPSPYLAGGHQLENARHLEKLQAVKVLQESEIMSEPSKLRTVLQELLKNSTERAKLAKNLNAVIKKDAAKNISDVILKQIQK